MARQFSLPNVAALGVNESTTVNGIRRSVVTRRVDAYASRCKPPKRFYVADNGEQVYVTRLPDPEPQP